MRTEILAAALKRRRGGAPDKTTALYEPAAYPPGALPDALTFSGEAAAASYVADGSGGLTATVGEALSEIGSGDSPTDDLSYGYAGVPATKFNGGNALKAPTSATGEVGSGHFVIRVAMKFTGDVSKVLIDKEESGSPFYGWRLVSAASAVYLRCLGTGAELTVYSPTLTAGSWYLLEWYIDPSRASAAICYANGTAGSVTDLSSLGAIASDSKLTFGASETAGLPGTASIQRFDLWTASDLLDGTTSTDWLACHNAALAQWTGQYLAKAKGTRVAATPASRSGHAFLRKEDATLGTLWVPVGDDVPAIEHDASGELCYAPIASQTALLRNSGDLTATYWTARGTASIAATDGPDGVQRNCRVTVGESTTNDLYSTIASTTSGSMSLGMCFRRPAGETGTVVFSWRTTALADIGTWSVDLSGLDEDAWYWLDADSPLVTVSTAMQWGSGETYLVIDAASGGVTCDICFPTLVRDSTAVRPILTTTAARTTGAETPMHWTDADNIPAAGRVTVDCDPPESEGAAPRVFSLATGATANNRVSLARYLTFDLIAQDTSAAYADITHSTSRETCRVEYGPRGVRGKIGDGAWTSYIARFPAGMDTIRFSGFDGSSPARHRTYSLRVEAL